MEKIESLNTIEIKFEVEDTLEVRRLVSSHIESVFQLVKILSSKI